MTASPGVVITHRMFHAQGGGEFIARPDICDDCRGASAAAAGKYGTPAAEQVAHPDNPPTYAELRRRAGTPLRERQRDLLGPTFGDHMAANGYVARKR